MYNYFKEISEIIESTEVNKKVRQYKDNSETLNNYWHIGKLLIEAQGGEIRAKYGNGLIKKWSKIFVEKYGKNYDDRNLRRMRQFYMEFPKWVPLGPISWSHFRYILPIKEEGKRNYYVNYIDKNIKEISNNKTIGILLVKKNNQFIIEYTTSNDIYVTTYKLVN